MTRVLFTGQRGNKAHEKKNPEKSLATRNLSLSAHCSAPWSPENTASPEKTSSPEKTPSPEKTSLPSRASRSSAQASPDPVAIGRIKVGSTASPRALFASWPPTRLSSRERKNPRSSPCSSPDGSRPQIAHCCDRPLVDGARLQLWCTTSSPKTDVVCSSGAGRSKQIPPRETRPHNLTVVAKIPI